MQSRATAERALDALGDPTRRRVFERVRRGTRTVREVAHGMAVSRPAVSQHLKILKAARLVVVRVEGTRRLYSVDRRGLESIRAWLDPLWDDVLGAYRQAVEGAVEPDGMDRSKGNGRRQ